MGATKERLMMKKIKPLRLFQFFFLITVLFGSQIPWAEATTPSVKLTEKEVLWIQNHPVIRHAPDPDFAPFEFSTPDGDYQGIASDYLTLIGQKLGITFKSLPSPSWADSLENVKQGRADLVTVAAYTAERAEYMHFTSSYIEIPDVILVRKNINKPMTLDDFKGKEIAVIEGWAANDYIREKYPEIHLKLVADVQKGLEETAVGLVDATVMGIATASHWIEKSQITNLRVAGETGYVYKLSFASRKDWPLLNQILEKSLNTITHEERTSIVHAHLCI